MSVAETFTPEALVVSATAIEKVRSLVEEEGNPDLKLRVFVTGGGCSGFQYGFAFEEQSADDDALIESGGVVVLVDSMSYPYLVGATLAYEEGLQGSRFKVENPNASSTCGCGSSFSV
ncbi:MAG: iron-sulfur cluster insertion protein [Flavobacteriales bacterium]|jgi:iron-sulfur cluster insertion protein